MLRLSSKIKIQTGLRVKLKCFHWFQQQRDQHEARLQTPFGVALTA